MGHLVFFVMHVIALLFATLALWITIPLHLIYGAASARSRAQPTPQAAADGAHPHPSTHVHCPDCAELVLKQAKVCRFCGCKLTPQA